MDYGKLDAGLAAALDDMQDASEESNLHVFIHAKRPLSADEAEFLNRMGIQGGDADKQILTATVSPKVLNELSEQPWVQYLRLSRTLRPLGGRRV
jgi:hypothetical protein